MARSSQKIIATAFITSGTGCRGLLPGDDAGFTVPTFRFSNKTQLIQDFEKGCVLPGSPGIG